MIPPVNSRRTSSQIVSFSQKFIPRCFSAKVLQKYSGMTIMENGTFGTKVKNRPIFRERRIFILMAFPFASKKRERFRLKSLISEIRMIGPPKISMIPSSTERTVVKEIPCRLFAMNAKALPIAAIPIPPLISIMGPLIPGAPGAPGTIGTGAGAGLPGVAVA